MRTIKKNTTKAKCPNCYDGCLQCNNGYFEASFEKGEWYTRKCVDCGFENGAIAGDYINSDLPEEPCVMCDSKNVIWLSIGEIA